LIGFGFGLYQWIDWGNDYYIVTDRRAIWLEKVIGLYDSRHEAPLRMVLSVSTTTDVSGRMMDYGDVVIRTFTGQLRFHTVGSPRESITWMGSYTSTGPSGCGRRRKLPKA